MFYFTEFKVIRCSFLFSYFSKVENVDFIYFSLMNSKDLYLNSVKMRM